ncbi:hypothetical protein QQ045_002713 [Rhodiola kirilowii]
MEWLIEERSWMYNRRDKGKTYNNDTFMLGVTNFIETAIARGELPTEMRCPCKQCKNKKCYVTGTVENHLYRSGFTQNYYNWTYHGEQRVDEEYAPTMNQQPLQLPITQEEPDPPFDHMDSRYTDMVQDVAGYNWEVGGPSEPLQERPNPEAQHFYDLLCASSIPAYEGCTTETELLSHMKLQQTKADYGMSVPAYNSVCDYLQSVANCDNRLPTSFNHSKKVVDDLGMGYKRIDLCVNGCMIYYLESEGMSNCTFCGEDRYHPGTAQSTSRYVRVARLSMFYLDIIPRLQRLFLMKNTSRHMS